MSRARRSWSWALVGLLTATGCVTGSGRPAPTTPDPFNDAIAWSHTINIIDASRDAPFAADPFDLVAEATMRRPLLERSEVIGDTVESVVLEPSAVTEPETP